MFMVCIHWPNCAKKLRSHWHHALHCAKVAFWQHESLHTTRQFEPNTFLKMVNWKKHQMVYFACIDERAWHKEQFVSFSGYKTWLTTTLLQSISNFANSYWKKSKNRVFVCKSTWINRSVSKTERNSGIQTQTNVVRSASRKIFATLVEANFNVCLKVVEWFLLRPLFRWLCLIVHVDLHHPFLNVNFFFFYRNNYHHSLNSLHHCTQRSSLIH